MTSNQYIEIMVTSVKGPGNECKPWKPIPKKNNSNSFYILKEGSNAKETSRVEKSREIKQ